MLFLWSFLAATILPMSSEVPLAALVYTQQQLILPVLVATVGNYLGACTTYWMGYSLATRTKHPTHSAYAWRLLQRYGQPILLLSWVPLIGDALVVLAGAMNIPFRSFSTWVVLGKGLRYLFIAWAALALVAAH